MNLVKIGNRIINMDQVVEIAEHPPDSLVVYLVNGNRLDDETCIWLLGDEAERFAAYLERVGYYAA